MFDTNHISICQLVNNVLFISYTHHNHWGRLVETLHLPYMALHSNEMFICVLNTKVVNVEQRFR